jgi:hypothetical protein
MDRLVIGHSSRSRSTRRAGFGPGDVRTREDDLTHPPGAVCNHVTELARGASLVDETHCGADQACREPVILIMAGMRRHDDESHPNGLRRPGTGPLVTHATDSRSRRPTREKAPAWPYIPARDAVALISRWTHRSRRGRQRHREAARCCCQFWARFRSNDFVFQLELGGADRLVDHLPDFLVQLVLLPDAVRGPQQHRGTATSPIAPLTAASTHS